MTVATGRIVAMCSDHPRLQVAASRVQCVDTGPFGQDVSRKPPPGRSAAGAARAGPHGVSGSVVHDMAPGWQGTIDLMRVEGAACRDCPRRPLMHPGASQATAQLRVPRGSACPSAASQLRPRARRSESGQIQSAQSRTSPRHSVDRSELRRNCHLRTGRRRPLTPARDPVRGRRVPRPAKALRRLSFATDCYSAATSATSATSEVLTAPLAAVPPCAAVGAGVPVGGIVPVPGPDPPVPASGGGPPHPPPS